MFDCDTERPKKRHNLRDVDISNAKTADNRPNDFNVVNCDDSVPSPATDDDYDDDDDGEISDLIVPLPSRRTNNIRPNVLDLVQSLDARTLTLNQLVVDKSLQNEATVYTKYSNSVYRPRSFERNDKQHKQLREIAFANRKLLFRQSSLLEDIEEVNGPDSFSEVRISNIRLRSSHIIHIHVKYYGGHLF